MDAPRPGWAPFLTPGTRVVVRYAIDAERSPQGESRSDALGTLTAVDEQHLTVMTRRGEVTVLRGLVVAAKEVPPPPERRGSRTVRTEEPQDRPRGDSGASR